MSTATILIADDDRAIRTVLNQALSRLGYQVRTTGTASMLWQWINDGLGDLVITDVVMPDENGLDLIPRVRKLRPDLRIQLFDADLPTLISMVETGKLDMSLGIFKSMAGLRREPFFRFSLLVARPAKGDAPPRATTSVPARRYAPAIS